MVKAHVVTKTNEVKIAVSATVRLSVGIRNRAVMSSPVAACRGPTESLSFPGGLRTLTYKLEPIYQWAAPPRCAIVALRWLFDDISELHS